VDDVRGSQRLPAIPPGFARTAGYRSVELCCMPAGDIASRRWFVTAVAVT
jgi:hypothetical protein